MLPPLSTRTPVEVQDVGTPTTALKRCTALDSRVGCLETGKYRHQHSLGFGQVRPGQQLPIS